tara:strand:- start:1325 stop:2572 length:1248 start_codon:yes stop_codon:yes gene_type:complete
LSKIKFFVLKRFGLYILGLLTSFSFDCVAQVQCANDVTIVEGESITMCGNTLVSISGSAGFVSYSWTGASTGSFQTITPSASGQYVLSAVDGLGCISIDTIIVVVNPLPTPNIISSEGVIICPSTGTTLSTSVPFTSYDWGSGNTNPTLSVSSPGTYNVSVIDDKGCTGSSNIIITSPNFSLTAAELSGCEGTGILLQASGGTSYAWSTGEFGSSIVITPNATTNYSVAITVATCTENLSLEVAPIVPVEFSLPDTIYIHENDNIYINGPAGFNTYNWSPSNQLNNPNSQGVVFSGTESQSITIVATHPTGCTLTATTVVIVVGLTIPNGFSPNGDLFNQAFVIPEIISENYNAKVTVWNRWGDIVLDDSKYLNTWEGTCEADLCLGDRALPEGTYFYNVDIHGVTFKGYITLKR